MTVRTSDRIVRRALIAALVAAGVAASAACASDAESLTGADYDKLCDAGNAKWRPHYDSLPALLVGRVNGALRGTGRDARLIPFHKLEERTDDDDFKSKPRPVALLLLEPSATNPTRSVCLLSYWSGDKSKPESWRVVRRAIRQVGTAIDTVTDTVAVTYRMKGTDDDDAWHGKKRPRPAARFDFLTENRLSMLRGMNEAPLGAPAGGPRRADDGEYAAWYRCGSGCCGAGLDDFY